MTSSRSLSRRSTLLGLAVAVAATVAGTQLGTAGASTGTPMRIENAASVTKRALRLGPAPAPTTTTTPTPTTTTTPPITGATPNANGLVFPMDPEPDCYVLSNFGEARSGGRTHQAIDILATEGQAIYAVADGIITDKVAVGDANSSLSGNLLKLSVPDTTYYTYAHLSGFAPGIAKGSAVRQGDVIGYVGDTGNPGEGNYHLHFEVHPKGGAAIDPLKVLTIPSACTLW